MVNIRRMKLEDLDQIMEIELEAFPESWKRATYEFEIVANPTARYLVAEKDGEILGYIGSWIILDEGHITTFAVKADYRGKSISDLLMKTALDEMVNNGASYSILEVRENNKYARNFYERWDFFIIDIRKAYYTDNKEDAIIMRKELIY